MSKQDEMFQNLLKCRRTGDRALWDTFRVLVEGMMRYGFKKTQIREFLDSIKKVEE